MEAADIELPDRTVVLTEEQLDDIRTLYGNHVADGSYSQIGADAHSSISNFQSTEHRQHHALLDSIANAVSRHRHQPALSISGQSDVNHHRRTLEQDDYQDQYPDENDSRQADGFDGMDMSLHQAHALTSTKEVLTPASETTATNLPIDDSLPDHSPFLQESLADMQNVEELRAEVKRLKEQVRRLETSDGAMAAAAAQTLGQLAAMTFPGGGAVEGSVTDGEASQQPIVSTPSRKPRQSKKVATMQRSYEAGPDENQRSSKRRKKDGDETTKTRRNVVPTSDATGKRVVLKERTDQLAKEIRRKMRLSWGQTPEESGALPGPEEGGPDWLKGNRHPDNVAFQEHIAGLVLHDLHTNVNPTSIPYTQQTFEACKSAAGTAFLNFAKRFGAQIDVTAKEKGARDNKRGRRWARKDLKQKKRTKAVARLNEDISQNILRMDYMSSENSSEGEDSDLMPGEWQRLANLARTDSDGRFLPDEKVLEVKTPRWRSMELQAVYDRIDAAAQQIVAEAKGRGHAAPPFCRFKLEPLRQKRPPGDVSAWMLVGGVLPDESSLPLPRRVKIGRPKGRRNKVSESKANLSDPNQPSPNIGIRRCTSKRSIGQYDEDISDLQTNNEGLLIHEQKQELDNVGQDPAELQSSDIEHINESQSIGIVALPTAHQSVIDPHIESEDNSANSSSISPLTRNDPDMELVNMDMVDSTPVPNEEIVSNGGRTYVWSGTQEMLLDGDHSRGTDDRGPAIQEYLMRFSSVPE